MLHGGVGLHTIEAVQLELRRLARACGLEITAFRVVPAGGRRSAHRG
jgi:hypothetical protein